MKRRWIYACIRAGKLEYEVREAQYNDAYIDDFKRWARGLTVDLPGLAIFVLEQETMQIFVREDYIDG